MISVDLNADQRDRFARNGFVVLRDAVPREILDDAVDAVAETVPEDLGDVEALVSGPDDRHYWGNLETMAPFRPLNETVFEYAAQLVGSGRLRSPGEFAQVAIRYPTGEHPCDPVHATTDDDGNRHVDVVGEDGELQPFTIGATTYLDDVHPRGGGLTVWPGTHQGVADYLGDQGDEAQLTEEVVDAVLDRNAQPFEVCGPAGTVVLWHNLLVHTGGQHLGSHPRIAAFTRFHHRDGEEILDDALRNPFEYWAGINR